MAQYQYRAIKKDGKVISGTYGSKSERELEQALSRLNMSLLSCKETRNMSGLFRKRTVERRDVINYCFYLEQMARSGIPIIQALNDLEESTAPSYLSEIIGNQANQLQEGVTFSDTFKAYPEVFPESFVNLIKAGERSGELVTVLKDLTETLTWQDEMIVQTKKAVMMPSFVAVVVFMVVFFLMTFLVPQLVDFILAMGQELPFHTRLLISISDFFVHQWYWVLITPIAIWLVLTIALKRSVRFRIVFDRFKLKIWVIGPIVEKIILARFANYLGLLYNSGIPVIESIKITQAVVDNKSVEKQLQEVQVMIAEGATIGQAFELGGVFPKLILRMVQVGEKTGDLGKALSNVSYFYKRDANDAIDNMQRVIEPAMTVVLGLIIGWVMMSVLGPIYDLISNIKS